jgi:hypothetical protein
MRGTCRNVQAYSVPIGPSSTSFTGGVRVTGQRLRRGQNWSPDSGA